MPGRPNKFTSTVAILAAAVAASSPCAAWAQGFALIVGISQYQDPTIPQLRFADADAQEIADNLRIYSSFSKECITLLLNRQATGAAIRAAFIDLDKRCSGNGAPGAALVYFAGHAVSDFKKTTRGETREFLVPFDASLDAKYTGTDGSENNDTFLKKEELATRLTNIRESQVAVVLDACHSGMPDFAGLMQYYINAAKTGTKEIALLAASSIEGTASEFVELKHGALTYEVLQTIKAGRAATPKTERYRLAMTTLYNEVKTRFKTEIVGGQPLSSYHEPQIALFPPGKPVQVAFADMRGDMAPPLVAQAAPVTTPTEPIGTAAPATTPQPAPAAKVSVPAPTPSSGPAVAVTPPAAQPGEPAAKVAPPTAPTAGPVANTAPPAPSPPEPAAKVTPPAQPAPAQAARLAAPEQPAQGQVARVTSPAPPAPQFGYVRFAGAIPSDSYVEIDGTSVHNWKRGSPLRVTPGPHIVVIGTTTYSYRRVSAVEVGPNRTATLNPIFTGNLTLKSRTKADPNQAGPPLEFSLDGRPLGQSTTELALQGIAAGTHKLTVRIFDTVQTTDISIRPDSPLTLVYLLQAAPPPAAPKRNVIPF